MIKIAIHYEMHKAQLGKEATELRDFKPSEWGVAIGIAELLEVISAPDTETMERLGIMMPKIQMNPRSAQVFSFIQKAQTLFANGLPLSCIETVLHESVLEAFLRCGGSICDYAPKTQLCYVDIDGAKDGIDLLTEKIKPFINSLDPMKSLVIKLPQASFISDDTSAAHQYNAKNAWKISACLLEALYRVSGMEKVEAKKEAKRISEANPDSNLGALNNYAKVSRLERIEMDSLEAVVLGPSFDTGHPRYAPEFCLVMNFHEDLESLGNNKRLHMQMRTKRANLILNLKKKGIEVPDSLSLEEVHQLFLEHYNPKEFDPYIAVNTILYPDPCRQYTEAEKKAFFDRLDDMLSRQER